LTQVVACLDTIMNILTSFLILHEGLYDTDCLIAIVVVPRLETVTAHEVSRMAMMLLQKVELVGSELVVGDMRSRVLFQLGEEIVAFVGIFGVVCSHHSSEDATTFLAVLFLVDGELIGHEEFEFTAVVLGQEGLFVLGEWWSLIVVSVLSRHDGRVD
jgi:hypothetical protein